jgi:hypothetical protein
VPHREKKRAHDFRSRSEELSKRLTRTLQEQRALVEQVGRESSKAGMRKDSDPCSESSRRRFIQQQEELVALREDNAALKQQLSEGELHRLWELWLPLTATIVVVDALSCPQCAYQCACRCCLCRRSGGSNLSAATSCCP